MKILQLTENYYPHIGGVSEHVFFLTQELRKLGHEVDILTSKMGRKADGVKEEGVIRIARSIVIPSNKSFSRITIHPLTPIYLREFLKTRKYDLTHTHGSLAPTIPLLSIKYSRTYNFLTLHAGHEKSLGYRAFRLYLERNYFKKLHGLIGVSKEAILSINKYFKGNYTVIPNGVNVDIFSPGEPQIKDLPEGEPKILFVGRLEPKKGLKYLLKAMPLIVEKFPKAKLLIMGDGFLKSYYKGKIEKKLLNQNILSVGKIIGEKRREYYRWCDIFCSPSIGHESFGITLLEAMATSKPIVCSNIPGYTEVVEDFQEGLYAEPKNPESIAEKIIILAKDKKLREKLGKNGRKKAMDFSWDKIAKKVENFYKEIINSRELP